MSDRRNSRRLRETDALISPAFTVQGFAIRSVYQYRFKPEPFDGRILKLLLSKDKSGSLRRPQTECRKGGDIPSKGRKANFTVTTYQLEHQA